MTEAEKLEFLDHWLNDVGQVARAARRYWASLWKAQPRDGLATWSTTDALVGGGVGRAPLPGVAPRRTWLPAEQPSL